MSNQLGRIVRILTFADDGTSSEAFWWAVIDDDAKAIEAVMMAAGTLADQGASIAGVLDPGAVQAYGLEAGQVTPAKAP